MSAECRVMDVLKPSGSFGVPALGGRPLVQGRTGVGWSHENSNAHPQGREQSKALQSMSCVSPHVSPEADCRIKWNGGRVWRSQVRVQRAGKKTSWVKGGGT